MLSFSGRSLMKAAAILFFILFYFLFSPAGAQKKRLPRKQVEQDKRVYLIHADNLHYDQYRNGDAQILKGRVHFRHVGANLYCDSAHFYEQTNSFEAFGHVKMVQGDTLSLTSDYAYYDGNDQLAQARHNVVLKHRKSTLYTDSLDYDRMYNFGNFFEGGKLIDGKSTLTSDWGEYHTDTKMAMFYYDVRLKDDKMYLTTDSLYYDTQTSVAHIVGPSNITSGSSTIYSENGYYNTKNEESQLFGRSIVKDQGRSLVGDSVYHNAKSGTNYAYRNVIFTDSVNKSMLTGDYCEYNDSTGYAMSTKRAVAIDYSQKDSLFMHADTFKIFTYNINTDSVYRVMHAYNKVRAYRVDVQAVCDSLVYSSLDSCMVMYRDPIIWNGRQQLFGEQVRVYMKNNAIDWAHVIGQAFSTEQLADTTHFNQVSSKEMKTFFKDGDMRESQAIDNVLIVYYPIDDSDSTLIGLNYTETPLMKMFLENKKMKRIWMDKPKGTLYPMTQIPPEKFFLPQYAWFDYVRPINKADIFNWRPKKVGTELKPQPRREAPTNRVAAAQPTPNTQPPTPNTEQPNIQQPTSDNDRRDSAAP
jgi:lipopolysaccharide export system protein LptA